LGAGGALVEAREKAKHAVIPDDKVAVGFGSAEDLINEAFGPTFRPLRIANFLEIERRFLERQRGLSSVATGCAS
jgi:hypothetical protein